MQAFSWTDLFSYGGRPAQLLVWLRQLFGAAEEYVTLIRWRSIIAGVAAHESWLAAHIGYPGILRNPTHSFLRCPVIRSRLWKPVGHAIVSAAYHTMPSLT